MKKKDNPVKNFMDAQAALPLPLSAKTRSGTTFTLDEHCWHFRDGTTQVALNFERLPELHQPILIGLKKTLLWYLENRAPKTACGYFNDFVWLIRILTEDHNRKIKEICFDDILLIKIATEKSESRLAHIRAFLVKWGELNSPGVEQNLAKLLRRIPLKQHEVGVAVATLDPLEGPLTDLEFEAIQTALNKSYADGEINSETLILCYLMMALGVRPTQLASLKCCDLVIPKTADGDYVLWVPRAKQPDRLERDEFKPRKLSTQLGQALEAHIKSIQAEFADRITSPGEIPVFPQRRFHPIYSTGFEHHRTASSLTHKIIRLFKSLKVASERLTTPIPMSPVRFRRTFATRAAEEGWPLMVLAELLDHGDTRNVEVYAGLTSRIRANFSRKIAFDMAPLAMAFSGTIIRDESEATRPNSVSRIVDLRIDSSGAGMGNCGSHAHCEFSRPFACYAGCYSFEPWLDGPHEAALDFMLARREYLTANTETRIASINDRAILGCAQIILRCRQILADENA
ncbi:site-specific integrase [Pseudomonas sp. CR3202]|uniref:site-specific integrase n=1 Tax=Pseudomonas sp. CR3202 TaxID=3351532 RepID=UPI003BF230FC